MSHDRTVIRHAVHEIEFGFFSDEDIRGLSVKQITSPVTFDSLNNPLPGRDISRAEIIPRKNDLKLARVIWGDGDHIFLEDFHYGLYDPALGPTEYHTMCETCGQDQKECPGHMGHVELAVDVYHPLLFGALYKLLRSKCFSCHHLRLSKAKARLASVKMMLVDAGRGHEARSLDEDLLGYLKGAESDADGTVANPVAAHTFREHLLGKIEQELYSAPKSVWCGGHDRTLRRELAEGLIKVIGGIKRCENCGAHSPRIRKDGSDKFFQVPLLERYRSANRAYNVPITSAVHEQYAMASGVDTEVPECDDSDPEMDVDEENGEDLERGGEAGEGINDASGAELNSKGGKAAHKFMPPIEVEMQMKLLWAKEETLLSLLFGSAFAGKLSGKAGEVPGPIGGGAGKMGYRLFFLRALGVPPPRFRPPMTMGDFVAEHPQNIYLSKILSLNEKMKNAEELHGNELSMVLSTWVELQTTVNCYMDSSKDPKGTNDTPPGLRQVLEKKEGLFRKHMMGKRVNFCCRSVISPDPYLGTTEIGIPLRFAKTLTFAQPVVSWNAAEMRGLVEAGAIQYPGANYVEDAQGRLIDLSRLSDIRRRGVAARLLSKPGQKVWRHLHDGDCMLVNRQPTLHKPGIMAHRVRVFRNPEYQTIRMHYANCNTYNADFDGDEINCHLPQNEVARAEANLIAFTDQQYIVPTNGKPLRGLIQDHVDAGVKLCSKDSFLTKGEYQQLVFQALAGLPGLEIVHPQERIHSMPPAVLRPRELWTGKQVMSTILLHLTLGLPQLNLDSKAKTPSVAFGDDQDEHKVLFREGELLRGVLDKGAFGSSTGGIVHAVQELYGATAAGKLLTALGRVLTIYMQSSGHTCGIEDLTLNAKAEEERASIIKKSQGKGQRAMQELLAEQDGQDEAAAAAGSSGGGGRSSGGGNVGGGTALSRVSVGDDPLSREEAKVVREKTARFLLGEARDTRLAEVDRHMQSALAPVSSDIIKACLPGGQDKPFPQNCFSLMVLTGGKGSMVNHSQVSCALGQQALEGRRVPIMVSGKSLPSFQAYESSPRANGFITDRFLTGIRPQEYYFHCMAGREGLVDTAVKTSRSGYLQRCLVKHLEELKVSYDGTVRDGEGCVYQFMYGEDGVDTTKTNYLSGKDMGFLSKNFQALCHKYNPSSFGHKGEGNGISNKDAILSAGLGFDPDVSRQVHHSISSAKVEEKRMRETGGGVEGGISKGRILKVGQAVVAKRLKEGLSVWSSNDLLPGWHAAIVTDVCKAHAGNDQLRYSLRYNADKTLVKNIPSAICAMRTKPSEEGDHECEEGLRMMPLLLPCIPDPVMSTLNPNQDLGCVSERFQEALQGFLEKEGNGLVDQSYTDSVSSAADGKSLVTKEDFELLLWSKYMRSLVAPGEAVGSIAAQSVGEPSTQMTLNTFHLAGHGGANVTLGIPRLREIIMTASKVLKTPSMIVPLREGVPKSEGQALARKLTRLPLSNLLNNKQGVTVRERVVKGSSGLWERHYAITLKTFPPRLMKRAFGLDFKEVCQTVSTQFVPHVLTAITANLRKTGEKVETKGGGGGGGGVRITGGFSSFQSQRVNSGVGSDGESGNEGDEETQHAKAMTAVQKSAKKAAKAEAEYESEDEDEEGQGTLKFGKQKEQASYGEMDEDEKAIWKAMGGKQGDTLDGGGSDNDDSDYEDLDQRRRSKNEVAGNGKGEESGTGEFSLPIFQRTNGPVRSSQDHESGSGEKDYFTISKAVANNSLYQGIKKDKKAGEVEVVVKLGASNRRLLMVSLVEGAAAKTMVRSHKGISKAFVIERANDGKNEVVLQTEGCSFETLWKLDAGDGILDLNKLTSNHVYMVGETFGVEAARASIMAEVAGVFGAYGIAVDPRHLSLIADHMTFLGGYRPLNRGGMADFSSPCLQMSFETTAEFLSKASVAGRSDRIKSPSARIVMGRVGDFGTGAFDLLLPPVMNKGVDDDR